ncbi:replication-relaxation family protein [Streptomyces sp. NPDC006552]|uniref:replication-relaxation family protein n=1 Tax=Streptomyces sp. NPDC006552 TaxID=3157179 RepID=UPI0033A83192
MDQIVLRTVPQGLGRLENMMTEVPLPITGSESSPGRGSAQADLVLCAPEHQLPVVFVEVDRGTMTPARVAQKIDRYHAYFARTGAQFTPWWQQRWHVRYGRPVVMFVFTARSETTVMKNADRWGRRGGMPNVAATPVRSKSYGDPVPVSWNRRPTSARSDRAVAANIESLALAGAGCRTPLWLDPAYGTPAAASDARLETRARVT